MRSSAQPVQQPAQQATPYSPSPTFDGLDDLSSAAQPATAAADVAEDDAFALFDELAIDEAGPVDVQAPVAESTPASTPPRPSAQPYHARPAASATRLVPRPSSGKTRPVETRARPQQPATANAVPHEAPSYEEIMGVASAPGGVQHDSSASSSPDVPSVFIHIGSQSPDDSPIRPQANAQPARRASAAPPHEDHRAPPAASITAQQQNGRTRSAPGSERPSSNAVTTRHAPEVAHHRSTNAAQTMPEESTAAFFELDTASAEPVAPAADLLGGHDYSAHTSSESSPERAANLLDDRTAEPEKAAHHTVLAEDADLLGSGAAVNGMAHVDDLDDFFQGGALAAAQPQAVGTDDYDLFAPDAARAQAATAQSTQPMSAGDLIGATAAGGASEAQVPGDEQLAKAVQDAQDACAMLPAERAHKVHEAIVSAHAYVDTRMVRCLSEQSQNRGRYTCLLQRWHCMSRLTCVHSHTFTLYKAPFISKS